jgi:hypothetical protein
MLARGPGPATPVQRFAITRNREQEGLGLPLPAGRLVAFAPGTDRPILIGRGAVPDRAVGDDVEIFLGPATGVRIEATTRRVGENAVEIDLIVTNDQSRPVRFELELAGNGQPVRSATRLARRGSNDLWTVTVPPNGTARLRYRP